MSDEELNRRFDELHQAIGEMTRNIQMEVQRVLEGPLETPPPDRI